MDITSNAKLTPFVRNNRILMLALDHRGSLEKLMTEKRGKPATNQDVSRLKKQIMESILPLASGVLIDPVYGIPAYQLLTIPHPKPYLLCIEKTGYTDSVGEKITELEYTVEELAKKGTKGIKILLYFNPHAISAGQQFETAKKVLDQCRDHNLPFFLEIVTYPIENDNSTHSQLVLDSVKYFVSRKAIPDVFKLEYPDDEPSCIELTKMLNGIPWILLTKGEPFDKFKEHLGVAIQNGASGFLAGRSVWQEFYEYPEDKQQEFFNTVAQTRFKELVEIALR
jgi:tagatose-1,6-bisphosphate aldolase